MKNKNTTFLASESSGEVSGLLNLPAKAKCLLLAHGAGAGMNHPFMGKLSYYLGEKGIGTLRYNFPYTEKKGKRPDPAPILMGTVRSAVKEAAKFAGDIPLFAGGKSMGGRMTSMAASEKPLEGVKGIVFVGFPLHRPGGTPNVERSEHLFNVTVPMLFLQGTCDKLADLTLLNPIVKKLKDKASLHIIDGADHSFHLLKSAGRSDDEAIKELAQVTSKWFENL